MSVNIQSVIDNTTWYIAIEVINSVGRDRTEFTNLTELISKILFYMLYIYIYILLIVDIYSTPCHSFTLSLTSTISRTVKTTSIILLSIKVLYIAHFSQLLSLHHFILILLIFQ